MHTCVLPWCRQCWQFSRCAHTFARAHCRWVRPCVPDDSVNPGAPHPDGGLQPRIPRGGWRSGSIDSWPVRPWQHLLTSWLHLLCSLCRPFPVSPPGMVMFLCAGCLSVVHVLTACPTGPTHRQSHRQASLAQASAAPSPAHLCCSPLYHPFRYRVHQFSKVRTPSAWCIFRPNIPLLSPALQSHANTRRCTSKLTHTFSICACHSIKC